MTYLFVFFIFYADLPLWKKTEKNFNDILTSVTILKKKWTVSIMLLSKIYGFFVCECNIAPKLLFMFLILI